MKSVQKNCLKSIYGFNKSYDELLDEAGLETLQTRRESRLKKFTEKAVLNKQFNHWFPTNDNRASQRINKKYKELFAKSDRLYCSLLFEMRRVLNNSEKTTRSENTDIIDLSNLFNQP